MKINLVQKKRKVHIYSSINIITVALFFSPATPVFVRQLSSPLSPATPVFVRQLSTPVSSRKTKFSPLVQQFLDSTMDTASIYSAPSMLSLHSIVDGGSSRPESERGEVYT